MGAGFFYGLYMDPELLKALGYRPEGAVQACLKEYRLDLQGAAKVIPQKNSEVWEMILQLPEEDLAKNVWQRNQPTGPKCLRFLIKAARPAH